MFDIVKDDLPNRPGVGYKPQHYASILENPGALGWIEVHAENYMGAGGRPHAQIRHLTDRFPRPCSSCHACSSYAERLLEA